MNQPHISIKEIQGVKIDLGKIEDRRYLVKKIYEIITKLGRPGDEKSVEWRITALRSLKNMFRTDFKNTREFKDKIENYLEGYDLRKSEPKYRLKKARKKANLTQKDLAKLLGYKSQVSIAHFEEGKRYPPKKILQWLGEQENITRE